MTDPIIFRPKIILLGDATSGKSKFISRLNFPGIEKKFEKRLGVVIYKVPIKTNIGTLEISFWDTCGQERFDFLRDAYFRNTSLALLFFDLTNPDTYVHLIRWNAFHTGLRFSKEGAKAFVIGTKLDLVKERKISVEKIFFPRRHEYPYFEISSVTNYGIASLLHALCKTMLDDESIRITQTIRLLAPEKNPDVVAMNKAKNEFDQAQKIPVPTISSKKTFGSSQNQEFENDLRKEIQ